MQEEIVVIGSNGKSLLIERLSDCDFSKYSKINSETGPSGWHDTDGIITRLRLWYKKNTANEFTLRFVELKDELNITEKQKIICEASVILVVVDSPSLMNDTDDGSDLGDSSLKFLLSQLSGIDKLVLFAPVKCSQYMEAKDKAQDMTVLCLKLQNKYNDTILFLKNAGCTIAISPVITEFSSKDKPKTLIGRFFYRRIGLIPNAFFQEQLILTLIRFRLERERQKDKRVLKIKLFKELVGITRIIKDDAKWNKLLEGKNDFYGINPERSEQGFMLLHDPHGYFKDL